MIELAPDVAMEPKLLNHAVADRSHEAAGLLEAQRASPFRVSAHRHAAETVAALAGETVRGIEHFRALMM